MSHHDFIKLVDAMMTQQQSFFRAAPGSSERHVALKESKALEKQVRDYIKEYKKNDNQLNLLQ